VIDWSRLDGRDASAEGVGPFPHRPFLETWSRHRVLGDLRIVEHGPSLAVVIVDDDGIRFAGDPDVTDYHAPLGDDPGAVMAASLAAAAPGTRFAFDSMPAEVADPVAATITATGRAARVTHHESAMVIDLDPEHPLGPLDAKQRHEVRRKARRFADALGEPDLVAGPEGFEAFVDMHRMAEGEKGEFFDDAMEAFFRDLLAVPGSSLDILTTGSGDPAAAAFGFVDDEAYYLYNSSFDPALAASSPGIVLVSRLIERESSGGRTRFDLLKGTEAYKTRLGARARELFVVEGVV
jgi:CelD/BcsL family acetyltransferase involved in cellulose biosynthesis